MKKTFFLANFLLVAASLLLYGCSEKLIADKNSEKAILTGGETRMITDMAGRTVSIPRKIESFGYPYPANTLDFLAIGVGHSITVKSEGLTADDPIQLKLIQWGYTAIQTATPAFLGNSVNCESVLKAKPQVVILDTSNIKGIRQLAALGIPVVGVKFPGPGDGFADCVSYLEQLGDIFGGDAPQRAARYKAYVDTTLTMLRSVTADTPVNLRPRVLLMSYWSGNYGAMSGKTITESITAAGGINVMEGQSSHAINKEQILVWNPDVILLQTENQNNFDKFKNDNALKTLKAVKSGKVYPFWISHGGRVENILLAVYIATILHPDQFSETYRTDAVISFHQTMYGITLSKEAASNYFIER